jgi:DNA-binding CsgD family transcriptional regulator
MDARYSGLPEQGPASAARDEADGTPCYALSRQLLRINDTMARFARADSLTELVRQAPVLLCGACDFDRAMISRVRGSTWTPAAVHVAVGAADEVNAALVTALRTLEIPLTGSLAETEVLRRRTPMLVAGTSSARHTFEGLAELFGPRAYVVAPIVIADRVAGFLHADAFASGRELTVADRAGIQIFAAMFGLLYERAAMGQRLRDQRQSVADAIAAGNQSEIGLDVARLVRTQARRPAGHADHDRGGNSPLPPVHDGALTSREWEILRLLASGATNAQIASSLVVSDNTVKSHIKRILRKLPAANRAEAVYRYTQLAGQVRRVS